MQLKYSSPPKAILMLEDGKVFEGRAAGKTGTTTGEICFNTGMTGYQEIMTDPSFAGQIINFAFPHIGNVGANGEDIESINPAARGLIIREDITDPSNWRNTEPLNTWMIHHKLTGISGVDTRALTRLIRDNGAPNGVIAYHKDGVFDLPALQKMAMDWPGLNGLDLAKDVTCAAPYSWDESLWTVGQGYATQTAPT